MQEDPQVEREEVEEPQQEIPKRKEVEKHNKKPEPKERPKPIKKEPEVLPSLEKVLTSIITLKQPKENAQKINIEQMDPTKHSDLVQKIQEDVIKTKEKMAENAEEQKKEEGPKNEIKFKKIGGKSKAKDKEQKVGAKDEIMQKPNMDDVEYLRSIIQSLTKTTQPLGKSMDFISEDIETMTKEYEMWRKQTQSAKAQLEEELKKTDDTLQPLQDKLAEIEGQIQEQKEKIRGIKSQIFKNEETVQGLLTSVTAK